MTAGARKGELIFKRILLPGILLLATRAGAELVEGGQGIVAGTMTIQGSAFSVGASSLVVVGSSVGIRNTSPAAALDVAGSVQIGSGTAKSTFTASGQLKLNAFGIQWADGTTTASAPSASTNTIPWFSSQTFRDATCITFSNLTSPAAYSLVYHSTVSSTSGADNLPELYAQVNGDTVSRSSWSSLSFSSWNGTQGQYSSSSSDRQAIASFECGYLGRFISGQATILTGSGVTAITGAFSCAHYVDGRSAVGTVAAGYPADMTSIQLCRKTGTFTGWAKLVRLQD